MQPYTGSGHKCGGGLEPVVTDPVHRDLVPAPSTHRQSPQQTRAGHTNGCQSIMCRDPQARVTMAHCRDCRCTRAGLPGVEPGTRNHGVNQLFGRRLLRRPKGNAMRATGRAHRLPTSAVGLECSDSPVKTREEHHASDLLRRSRPHCSLCREKKKRLLSTCPWGLARFVGNFRVALPSSKMYGKKSLRIRASRRAARIRNAYTTCTRSLEHVLARSEFLHTLDSKTIRQ